MIVFFHASIMTGSSTGNRPTSTSSNFRLLVFFFFCVFVRQIVIIKNFPIHTTKYNSQLTWLCHVFACASKPAHAYCNQLCLFQFSASVSNLHILSAMWHTFMHFAFAFVALCASSWCVRVRIKTPHRRVVSTMTLQQKKKEELSHQSFMQLTRAQSEIKTCVWITSCRALLPHRGILWPGWRPKLATASAYRA